MSRLQKEVNNAAHIILLTSTFIYRQISNNPCPLFIDFVTDRLFIVTFEFECKIV